MGIKRFLAELYPLHPFSGIDPQHYPEDLQSFFYEIEAFTEVVNIVRPAIIIEVGTWKGHSANAIADICKSHAKEFAIICVDTWLGSREHYLKKEWLKELHFKDGRPTIYERFIGNTLRRGNAEHIYPLALPSETASVILVEFEVTADLIYIDAGLEYEDVIADLRSYFPLLGKSGVMFGDDFHYMPLQNAVCDFARSVRLGVCRKGSKWVLLRDASELSKFVSWDLVVDLPSVSAVPGNTTQTRQSVNSFDVFDTLIARRFLDVIPILKQLELEFRIDGFVERRIAADDGTASLPQIYERIGIDIAVMRRELQLEELNAIPILENLCRVRDGDLLISDMYLSASEILRMLRAAGLTKQVTLFQSNDGKRSGRVWRQLQTFKPALHVGDNILSDVQLPSSLGFACEHYSGANPTEIEVELKDTGLFHLACLVREIRLASPISDFRPFLDIACQLNLPLLFVAGELIRRKCFVSPVFLGRDCQLLFQLFSAYFGGCYYLPFSRKIAFRQPTEAKEYIECHSPPGATLIDMSSTAETWSRLSINQGILALIYSDLWFYTKEKPVVPDGFSFLVSNSEIGQTTQMLEVFNCADHGSIEKLTSLGPRLMYADFGQHELEPPVVEAIHAPIKAALGLASIYKQDILSELQTLSDDTLKNIFGKYALKISNIDENGLRLSYYHEKETEYLSQLSTGASPVASDMGEGPLPLKESFDAIPSENGISQARQELNILVLCHHYPNYVPDLLLHGLRKLLGELVVDYPRKDILYDGVLGQPYLERIPKFMADDKGVDRADIGRKLATGFFDLVICDVRALNNQWELLNANSCPLAIVDGEDIPAFIKPGNYVILRRETDGNDFSIPIPMALPLEILEWIDRYADLPKTHSIGFLGSRSADMHDRNTLLNELIQIFPDAMLNSWELSGAGRWQGRDSYYKALQSCHVVLTLPGAGYDTFRYWEHSACNALHAAKTMPLLIPDDYRHNHEIIRFSDVKQLAHAVEKVLSGGLDANEYSARARARLLSCHTTERRARMIIDRLSKAFGLVLS